MLGKITDAVKGIKKDYDEKLTEKLDKEAWEYCKNHFESKIEESQKNLRR